jgi:hypothetical protein
MPTARGAPSQQPTTLAATAAAAAAPTATVRCGGEKTHRKHGLPFFCYTMLQDAGHFLVVFTPGLIFTSPRVSFTKKVQKQTVSQLGRRAKVHIAAKNEKTVRVYIITGDCFLN